MNKSQTIVLTDVKSKIQLVDGLFNPSEANDLVNTLIGDKINFHKLQILSQRVNCDEADTEYHDQRILELEAEKDTLRDWIIEARSKGYQVRIDGTLEVSFI
jgi:hypothetical protein